MPTVTPRSENLLEGFRSKVQEQVSLGHLNQAILLCEEAIAQAKERGDRLFADRAFCNRASILIVRGEGSDVIAELREILLRSTDLQNRFSASYHISQHYFLVQQSSKSLFYARQALRYAEDLGEPEAQLRALNAIGNPLLLDSYFEQAKDAYEKALRLYSTGESIDRSILLVNIGYCCIVTGLLGDGYRKLTQSLRMMRRLRSEAWQHLPLLGLAYACLETQHYDRARRHAAQALELAECGGISGGIKNALFLLGEAEKHCGSLASAYERFHQLQSRFYPDNPSVIDVLMAIDVRKMINLMA